MQEWQDSTSYSQRDKERKPRVWTFDVTKEITIIVHKYAGFGDEWFIACKKIGINMADAKTTDVQEAKEKALSMVYSRLNALSKEYRRAALSIEGMV